MECGSSKKSTITLVAAIISWIVFGPFEIKNIPYTEIPFPEQKYILPILFAMATVSFAYFCACYLRLKDSEKMKVDIWLCGIAYGVACVMLVAVLIRYLQISIVNIVQSALLAVLGVCFGISISTVITSAFSYRSDDEMVKYGFMRYPPSATMLLRRAIKVHFPIFLVSIIVIAWGSIGFQRPLDRFWWIPFFGMIVVYNSGHILDIVMLIIPGKIRTSALENLKILRPAMDLHELDGQFLGVVKFKPFEEIDVGKFAFKGDSEKVKEYLENGGDPNVQDGRGWTALMYAVAENHVETATLLLAYGADPNIQNWKSRTAICYAARYANLELIELLLSHKATVNPIGDPEDCSPLLAASMEGHADVVELLLNAGADASVKTRQGDSCLDVAMSNNHGKTARLLRVHQRSAETNEDNPLPGALKWASTVFSRTPKNTRKPSSTKTHKGHSDWKLRIVEEPEFSIHPPDANGKYSDDSLVISKDMMSLNEIHVHVRLNEKTDLVQKYTLSIRHLSMIASHALNSIPELQKQPLNKVVTLSILRYINDVHEKAGIIDRTGLFSRKPK